MSDAPLMHRFDFHIGDYHAATSYLTKLEDLAYRRMMDCYYRDEKPLDTDLVRVGLAIGYVSDEEVAAVRAVLDRFFVKETDGYHQKRIDEEISAYRKRVVTAQENGKKGGKKPTRNRVGNQSGNQVGTDLGTKRQTNHPPSAVNTVTTVTDGQPSSAPTVWDLWVALAGEKHRSTLGGLIRAYGEDVVSNAVAEVSRKRPGDPVSYLHGILKAQAKKGAPPRIVV